MIDSAMIKSAAGVVSDVADRIQSGRRTYTSPEDVAALRLGGGALGAVGGGLGGGLAGLLGHYVAADEKKRRLKDYLKTMLIGGGLGAGAGGLGLGWFGGALGEEMRSRNPLSAQLLEQAQRL